jgi:DNA-binding NtrC family response regulator
MMELKSYSILLVDDEDEILLTYTTILKSAGIKGYASISNPRDVLPFLKKNEVKVIILDLSMPFISGIELIPQIREQHPSSEIIVISALNELETAVKCMKMGAVDYILKPVDKVQFISSIERTLEIKAIKKENLNLKEYLLSEDLKNPQVFKKIITISNNMFLIFKYIEAISKSPFPVLVTGETGTGKELIAESIHLANPDSANFVKVNVAGLDDTMFSDTLFGHKKGAFTGAESNRNGLISQADNGTIFLDEIGDLSPVSQVKLLRLIQEKEYYQLGSDLTKKTNVRIIVATNKNLKECVKNESFRKDLYFRLSAHQIHIPPLRERYEDIKSLTNFFLAKASSEMGKKSPTPPPELYTILSNYSFPGNIRELEALIYDAVSRHKAGILSLDVFRPLLERENINPDIPLKEKNNLSIIDFFEEFPTLKETENFLIQQALKKANGNQRITSSLLGISRQALNKRLIRKKNGSS